MAADPAVSKVRSGLQFSLLELFGLTTFAACTTAVAKAWDIGTLVGAIGAVVSWFNYCGRFSPIQVGLGRSWSIVLGAVLLLISMFLPAFKAWGDMMGWATAWTMLALAAPPSFYQSDSDGGATLGYFMHLPWILLTDVANIAGALTPITLIWRKEKLRRVLGIALHAAVPVVWLVIIGSTKSYLMGYYVWAFSLTLLASTSLIDRTTARTMLVSTSIFGITRLAAYVMQITL